MCLAKDLTKFLSVVMNSIVQACFKFEILRAPGTTEALVFFWLLVLNLIYSDQRPVAFVVIL